MAHGSMLHIRVDDEVKAQATGARAAMGPSTSGAVRIFLKRIVNAPAFPLELKVPDGETRAAVEDARAIMQARPARFASADTPIDALEETR